MNRTSVHRSPVPKDLRATGPSSEVTTYWQEAAFEWYGEEVRGRGTKNEMFVQISKTRLRISHTAAASAGIEPGDSVKIGINKAYLAIKKEPEGFVAKDEKNKSTKAVYVSATAIVRELIKQGTPIPCRVSCVWDAKSGMLVAKKLDENQNAIREG
ncbi:hypothetical protein JCM15765_02390 [Paradesulfitobacterium aromaticivorans]